MPHRVCEDRVLAADTLIAVRKSENETSSANAALRLLLGGEIAIGRGWSPIEKKSVI